MDTRRIVVALVVALALAGGAAYFFAARLKQSGPAIQLIKVVATAKELPAGIVLKAEDLALVDWPSTVQLTGSFSKPDEVVGRSTLYPLGAKEPVLQRDLAVAGSGFGLTAKIPTGMRATSVRSNEIVGVAGFLFPGSHVDVLATFRPPGGDSPVTQTVLQDVEVLTAGQRIQPDPEGKPQTVNVVTLLLSPEDSEKLLLASTQATIQFVLRSGADKERVDTKPVSLDELIAGMKKPPVPAPAAAHRVRREAPKVAPKPPDIYTVEVIHGDKRSVEKFE
ncbi:MAG: Flp pilus assembly protein CpaB [Terriglobia bacterium]